MLSIYNLLTLNNSLQKDILNSNSLSSIYSYYQENNRWKCLNIIVPCGTRLTFRLLNLTALCPRRQQECPRRPRICSQRRPGSSVPSPTWLVASPTDDPNRRRLKMYSQICLLAKEDADLCKQRSIIVD